MYSCNIMLFRWCSPFGDYCRRFLNLPIFMKALCLGLQVSERMRAWVFSQKYVWVLREVRKCERVLCAMLCETASSYKAMECNGVTLSSFSIVLSSLQRGGMQSVTEMLLSLLKNVARLLHIA